MGQGIVVESNFKIYAYTWSALHVSLLGLFCRVTLRLPNMIVGIITAEAVIEALKKGIRVENILRYLEGAAHPRALRRKTDGGSVVPDNVRVQLEVWESNRSRITTQRAVLFEWELGEIDTEGFDRACVFAK